MVGKSVSLRFLVLLTAVLFLVSSLGFIAQAADNPIQVATGTGTGTIQFGLDIASAGDFNNDGTDDVIVGAPGENKAYIFLGPVTDLTPASADTVLTGAASSSFGFSVASAGLNNADAFGDVIVGAPGEDKAYIFHGSASPAATIDYTAANVDFTGTATEQFGWDVACAMDVDADGGSDIIISAPAHQESTNANAGLVTYWDNPTGSETIPDATLAGHQANALFGNSISPAGDYNGDGYDDILVGAPGVDSNVGGAYIKYGAASVTGNTLASSMNVRITGNSGGANPPQFGASVTTTFDVGGDFKDDIMIGAPATNGDKGQVIGIYGGSVSGTHDLTTNNPNWEFNGEKANDKFGISISYGLDLDGDNENDTLVGASGTDGLGAVYGFYGPYSQGLSLNAGTSADFKIIGATSGDELGSVVAFGGMCSSYQHYDFLTAAKTSTSGIAYVYTVDKLPTLTNPLFDPATGTGSDMFTFNITYKDREGDMPVNVLLHVYNDSACTDEVPTSPIPMVLNTGSDYVAGVEFTNTTTLPHGQLYIKFSTQAATGILDQVFSPAAGLTGPLVDAIVPGTVTDMTNVTHTTEGQLKLEWTFPGDDDFTGSVTYAKLVYNESTIDAANFDDSILVEEWDGSNPPTVGGLKETVTITGLTKGVDYNFAFKAQDDFGQWGTLDLFTFTAYKIPNLAGPDPIADVIATDVSGDNGGAVEVEWTATDAADFGYYLFYAAQSPFTNITGLSPIPDVNLTDNNNSIVLSKDSTGAALKNGRTYYFAVVAYDEDGLFIPDVTVSDGVKVINDNGPTPPLVTGVAIADTPDDEGSNLTITWDQSTAADFGMYKIYVSDKEFTTLTGISALNTYMVTSKTTTTFYVTTYGIKDLTEGMEYWTAVTTVSWNDIENKQVNETNNYAGPARPIDNKDKTVPAQVINVKAYDTGGDAGGSIDITWKVQSNLNFGYYNVYISESLVTDVTKLTPETRLYDQVANSATVTTVGGSAIVDGTDYYVAVTVSSWNDVENEIVDEKNSFGPIQSVNNQDKEAPGSVAGFELQIKGQDQMILSWTPFTTAELPDFGAYVYEYWALDNPAAKKMDEVDDITVGNITVIGLEFGKKYRFEIFCRDDNLNEGPRTNKTGTPGGPNTAPVINDISAIARGDYKVDFSANVVDDRTSTSELEYKWDFDNDGTFDYTGGKSKTHTYKTEGVYTYRLVVSDGELETEQTGTVDVAGPSTPTDDDTVSPQGIAVGVIILVVIIAIIIAIFLIIFFMMRKKKIEQEIEEEKKPVYDYHTLVKAEQESNKCPSCGAQMSLNRYTEYCPICGAVLKESELDDDLKAVREAQEGESPDGEGEEGAEGGEETPKEDEVPDVDLPPDDVDIPADADIPEGEGDAAEEGGEMPELEASPELETLPELDKTE